MELSTVKVAAVAVFAALQVLLTVFPFTITLGVSGQITLGVIGGPLIGILLGPLTGGLAVLAGSILGGFLNPSGAIFGWLSPLPPFLGSVAAGCVKLKKGYLSGAIILVGVLLFYANSSASQAFVYPWLHVAAAVMSFSPIAYMAGHSFESEESAKPVLGIVAASIAGVLADHAIGSGIAAWYFSLPAEVWHVVTWVYPVERAAAIVLVTLIAVPVFYALKRAGLADLVK